MQNNSATIQALEALACGAGGEPGDLLRGRQRRWFPAARFVVLGQPGPQPHRRATHSDRGSRSTLESVADAAELGAQSTLQDTLRRLTLELKSRHYSVVLARQELELATEVVISPMGVIALAGESAETGVIMIVYLDEA